MKQTAVNWLIEQIMSSNIETYHELYDRFEKARQIEKEQIIKAWDNGHNDGWNTRENDYNPNYHKTGTGQEWYDYEFNYKYGQLKQRQ